METLQTLKQWLGSEKTAKEHALQMQSKLVMASRSRHHKNQENNFDKQISKKMKTQYASLYQTTEFIAMLSSNLWEESRSEKNWHHFKVNIPGWKECAAVSRELLYEIVEDPRYGYVAKVKSGPVQQKTTFSTIVVDTSDHVTAWISDVFPGELFLPTTITESIMKALEKNKLTGTITGNACINHEIYYALLY